MKRLKNFGGAVAMALALTAVVGVSSASANWFVSQESLTTWNGSRVGKNHVLSLGGESFSCKNVSSNGNTSAKVTASLTVTPELAGCSWLGYEVGWAMNGCKLRFHPGGPGEKLVGSVDIVGCEKPMSFTVASCVIEIPNQNGLGTVEYKNSVEGGTEVITAVANLTEIAYTRAAAAGCAGGGAGTFYNGTYTGEWKLKGSSGGKSTSVKVESAALPSPSKFTAQEAPATVTAKSGLKFMYFPKYNGSTNCISTGSTESPTAETGSLTVSPTLSKCQMLGTEVGVTGTMGGCGFKYNASGSLEIVGASCASSPITLTDTNKGSECTITVGPQKPLPGLKFTNLGTGRSRYVSINTTAVVGIEYTVAGPGCSAVGGETGTFTDGQTRATFTTTATNAKGASQGIWVE